MATGQVLAPKAQDLLTQCWSLGCEKDSHVSYPVEATALSREGNNLGAASLHCVLLFPLLRGGCISQQEVDKTLGWLKVKFVCAFKEYYLSFLGISVIWNLL